MPTSNKNIFEIARDCAEAAELSAALEARAPIAPTQDESRKPWVEHWLELSEWARQRELRELMRELAETLEQLREASDVAQQRAADALEQSSKAEAFFSYVVECHDPQATSEIAHRLAETRFARDVALQALKVAAEQRNEYADAKAVVAVAQLRSQAARQHYAQIRAARTRGVASGFLAAIVVLIATAIVLRHWFHAL